MTLDEPTFQLLRGIIHAHSGISLNDSKRALVEARLQRRLHATGAESFLSYARSLARLAPQDGEIVEMLNCMTTNKTSFFREPHHFDLLEHTIVPSLVAKARRTGEKRIRIWSAGCSTGEEPYSIAMSLRRALGPMHGWDVRILASDIDTHVLQTAAAATYGGFELEEVPAHFRRRAFVSVGDDQYRVASELRDLITFRRINLADAVWPIRTSFDVVFCRNVVIYFDRDTQRSAYERIVRVLAPHGHLVAGHSENLYWMPDLFRPVGGTVYRIAQDAASLPPPAPRPAPAPIAAREVAIQAGDVHASGEPTRVRTVLGSCIAVCLYDPVTRVGGVNHFMLPEGDDEALPARFGIHAMDVLITAVMKLGAARDRLVAKVFGGANLVPALSGASSVADRNVAFIEQFLADEGIALVAKKVGGEQALVVHFETQTGRARVRAVGAWQTARVHRREQRVALPAPPPDVLFFDTDEPLAVPSAGASKDQGAHDEVVS